MRGKPDPLRGGIRENLSREVAGKKIFLEMRLPDGKGGIPFPGMDWLPPIAARWNPLEPEVMENTVTRLREKLRLPDPENRSIHYLAARNSIRTVSCMTGSSAKPWAGHRICQTKWRLCAHSGMAAFLSAHHNKPIFIERMGRKDDGRWYIGDAGNGEQCWCRAIARLRRDVGLPVFPDGVNK